MMAIGLWLALTMPAEACQPIEGVRDLGIRPKLPQVTVEPSFVADSERRP